jgi:hemerythrin
VVEGREELGLATLNALKFWLIDHILNADKVFADYYHLNHPNRHKNRASTSTGPELDSARH